ncbi:uncharacterized protein LOC108052119 isoform X2 [Drosophila rhopaloa]|uniref:Uncharacterized protein n=1 Tax=Drosophila rhopaloa TaxID=1041015 RepID=A0ABM5J9Z5_DRORH|nr:uncharacterized protein LOC108052119 isoform X2 [Drosophila rhopaloa]
MSFTMTNRSLIRFESAKDEDEWKRTLIFFNVDISGAVCCDRRNEITAPRTSECNGKRRNPGGGLGNPITESAMSFGAPNKFHAHSHDDFDHGNYSRRRDNSAYFDSCRHFHHRTTEPRRGIAVKESVSPCNSVNSADFHFTPDNETERLYEHDEYYEEEECEPCHKIDLTSEFSEEEKTFRHYQKIEPNTYSRFESPNNYYSYSPRQTQEHYRETRLPEPYERDYYYREEPHNNYKRDYIVSLPRDPRSTPQKSRPKRIHRQASGYLPREHAPNYYLHEYKDYKNRNDYKPDQNYKRQPAKNYQNQYSDSHHFDYPDYYEHKRLKPPRTPFPKPQPKYHKYYSNQPSYKDINEPLKYPRKMYKAEVEPRFQDEKMPFLKPPEAPQIKYNRSNRHYQPEKIPHRKSCNHCPATREAAKKYDEISKDIFSLGQPLRHNFNNSVDRSYKEKKSNRKLENRYKIHSNAEQSNTNISKKYFKDEVSPRKNPNNVNNDVPRPQRILRSGTKYLNKSTSREYNRQKSRSYHKSPVDQKKAVDFVRFKDLNEGSEIPHRIRECSKTPSSIFFTIEIPYKKKERKQSYPQKNRYITKRSDSGCETFASNLNSDFKPKDRSRYLEGNCKSNKLVKPQTSIYDAQSNFRPKTIRQKISGFLKRSKICLKRSKLFGNNSKILKPGQSRPNGYHNKRSDSALNSPKTSNQSMESRIPIFGPSLKNVSQRYLSRIRKRCPYPTVYRGKSHQLPENNNEMYHEYSMYNVLSSADHRPKVNNDDYDRGLSKRTSQYFRTIAPGNSYKVSNRVSSGNCSLYSKDTSEDPIKPSQINVCLTIRATDVSLSNPRIISSKVIRGHGLSSKGNDHIGETDSNMDVKISTSPNHSLSRQTSGCTLCGSNSISSHENLFKNVREPKFSCSLSSNSSKSVSFRSQKTGTSHENKCNQKSTPPDLIKSRSPQKVCPRHHIRTKWSLTRHSKSCNHQPDCGHCFSPDRLENNNSRPCRSNMIEKCSKPPTLCQSDTNKRSCLKGVSNKTERIPPKRIILKTNSSKSLVSRSVSRTSSSNKSLCPTKNKDLDITNKSKCHRSQSHNITIGDEGKIEVPPRKSCSCPRQRPKTFPKVPIRRTHPLPATKSECASKVSPKTSESTIDQMQLACCPDPIPKWSCGPQSEYASSFPALPSQHQESMESSIRGDLCCPKISNDWDMESSCRRSFVEELKKELLESFRTEQQIESHGPFLRPTPQIMIFPCVPDAMCQPSPNINPILFRRPESVVCWAPCSKAQAPL